MKAAILAEMCSFPRAVQAVAESIRSNFPSLKMSKIVDSIHAEIGKGIGGEQCTTKTGQSMLVWRK